MFFQMKCSHAIHMCLTLLHSSLSGCKRVKWDVFQVHMEISAHYYHCFFFHVSRYHHRQSAFCIQLSVRKIKVSSAAILLGSFKG